MKFYLLSLLLVFCFVSVPCRPKVAGKDSSPIIVGFAITIKETPLYKQADLKSEILKKIPERSRLDLLDFNDEKFWKISLDGSIGFIPKTFSTNVTENFVMTFDFVKEYASTERSVRSDGLRLREVPFLDSKVVGSLKRNDQVKILAMGNLYQLVDRLFENWFFVKTESGKMGFVYAGYIWYNYKYPGYRSAVAKYPFLEVNREEFIAFPGANDLDSHDSYCGERGNYFNSEVNSGIERISGRANHKGVNYYLVDEYYSDVEGCSGVTLWISEKNVTLLEDPKTYTLKYKKNFDPKLLQILTVENYKALKVEEIPESKGFKLKFFRVNFDQRAMQSETYVYQNEKKDYFLLADAYGILLGDINKDKIPEVFICYTQGLNNFAGRLNIFNGETYIEKLSYSPEDEFSGMRFKEDHVEFAFDGTVDGCPLNESFPDIPKKVVRFKLEKGELVKIK